MKILETDMTSQYGAEKMKLDFPASVEFQALANIYDLLMQVNTKKGSKPTMHPRPQSKSNEIVDNLGSGTIEKDTGQRIFEIMNPAAKAARIARELEEANTIAVEAAEAE